MHGRTATPGLIDAHGHFADGGTNELSHVNLSQARSIAEVRALIETKLKTLKPGEWLEGDGWDEGKLKELRYIYASDLDSIAPDNPVWLTHTTGHLWRRQHCSPAPRSHHGSNCQSSGRYHRSQTVR